MSDPQRPGGGCAWAYGVALLAALVALPLLAVVWLALTPSLTLWQHLWASVLPDYLLNTLLLGGGVGLGALLLGVPLAWMTSVYDFPGRRWLDGALFLPLAMPTYLIAFVYTDFLEYAGPACGPPSAGKAPGITASPRSARSVAASSCCRFAFTPTSIGWRDPHF